MSCNMGYVVCSMGLPGIRLENNICLSFLDSTDSSHISRLDIKCFSRTFKELMYDASDVIISNLASCNFFWCGLIVPENKWNNSIMCTVLVFRAKLNFPTLCLWHPQIMHCHIIQLSTVNSTVPFQKDCVHLSMTNPIRRDISQDVSITSLYWF
jgi:hypothetical protein